MHRRENNLVTRLDDDEIAMIRELSAATDEPMTRVVRRLIRAAYVDRFGVGRAPSASAPQASGA
jgi:hypothetical protein